MRSDLDKLLRTIAETFISGRAEAREVAWLLLGVMMVAAILGLATLYIWILRGGLSSRHFFLLSQSMDASSQPRED